MNQTTNNAHALPCMVLTFTPKEIAIVKQVLEDEGYEDDLKAWILDNMQSGNEEESKYSGAADRVINNVSDFVRNNPDAVHAASTLVNNFFRRSIRKGQR